MQRSLRDIAALYDCDASFEMVEEFRRVQGLSSITSKCFQAANISALVVDDVSKFDKILELESHKAFAPKVYRVVGIETLAETIINEVSVPLLMLFVFFVVLNVIFVMNDYGVLRHSLPKLDYKLDFWPRPLISS